MFDQELLSALVAFVSASRALSFVAIFFAHWLPYLIITAAIVWHSVPLFRATAHASAKSLRPITEAVAAAGIAGLLVECWKLAYPIMRPFAEIGFTPLVLVDDPLGSFPSSHASVFAALGVTMYLRDKKTGTWFLVGALVVGLARIAVGVHYPIDILVGFLVGGAIALLFHGIFTKRKD